MEFDIYAHAFLVVRKARLEFLQLHKDSAKQEIVDAYFQTVRIENYLFSRCAEIHAKEIWHGNQTRNNPFEKL